MSKAKILYVKVNEICTRVDGTIINNLRRLRIINIDSGEEIKDVIMCDIKNNTVEHYIRDKKTENFIIENDNVLYNTLYGNFKIVEVED